MVEGLYRLFNRIWEEGKVPKKWNESRVTLLHKGGHKSRKELKNYRPIAVMDTVGKLFSGLLNERLRECCERCQVMGEEQNGFRNDIRGEDNMFIVNVVIDRMKKLGGKLYLAFLDIKNAYDRVNRVTLKKLLAKIGMSRKVVELIGSICTRTHELSIA